MKFIVLPDWMPGLFEIAEYDGSKESAADLGVKRYRDLDSGDAAHYCPESGRWVAPGWQFVRKVTAVDDKGTVEEFGPWCALRAGDDESARYTVLAASPAAKV